MEFDDPDGGQTDPTSPRRWNRVLVTVGAVLLLVSLIGVGASNLGAGDTDEGASVVADQDSELASGADRSSGRIHVRLEQIPGVFIEGFEIGLRFETGAGELIGATLWSDFVASTGQTDIDAYYDSVLTQPVPAGDIWVSAEVNIGAGPAPSVPDLSVELPCRLTIEVEPDQDVTVEVSFRGSDDCLRLAEARPAPTSAEGSGGSAPTTSTTSPTTAPPSTSESPSSAVGTRHYVDVDLECQAFELDRIWVLVEGDTSTWQPPDERHEGGTFTIESPDRGRFVGDAAGEKTAIFERVEDDDEAACTPVPRTPR